MKVRVREGALPPTSHLTNLPKTMCEGEATKGILFDYVIPSWLEDRYYNMIIFYCSETHRVHTGHFDIVWTREDHELDKLNMDL